MLTRLSHAWRGERGTMCWGPQIWSLKGSQGSQKLSISDEPQNFWPPVCPCWYLTTFAEVEVSERCWMREHGNVYLLRQALFVAIVRLIFLCCIHHSEHVKSSALPLKPNKLYSTKSCIQPTRVVSVATQYLHGWSWLLSICDFSRRYFTETVTVTNWVA